nr:MAG TPA: hypothetical protein [Caudoviricetes sp.]
MLLSVVIFPKSRVVDNTPYLKEKWITSRLVVSSTGRFSSKVRGKSFFSLSR